MNAVHENIPGESTSDRVLEFVNFPESGDRSTNKGTVEIFPGENDFEPSTGIEFDSHEAAYSFYQEYAKSMGFTTSIKNSRRSKKSKEFIDAKFACSRYGLTPESDTGCSRRSSLKKTNCKASMHVKRRSDGKWIIHEFTKEHNHELLPALAYHFRIHRNVKLAEKNNIDILHAVSERTRKMYVEMMRHSGRHKNVDFIHNDLNPQFEPGLSLSLDEGDAQILFEYFKCIKKDNPNFFYAVDLNEEQRLRNVFWVDEKSRNDYISFSDVVSLDSFYVKYHEKLPFAPFIGVNHHCQPILLGCALISDESRTTFVWLLKTWLRAMGGRAPKTIIIDLDKTLAGAIEEVLPNTRQCYALWHILETFPNALSHVMKRYEKFGAKFVKCIFKSWTDEDFDMRWWKMVTRFELQHNQWIQALYADRRKWVPTFVEEAFFAGLSANQRSESLNSFFDKYIHKKITLKEFMKQYGTILHNSYEEESVADFDTLHKQPALKSPSPWEKQMSLVYTHAIFKKFQVEVLGVVGCHPKKESDDGTRMTFRVQDCEKEEYFLVSWDRAKCEVSCLCHLFEYKGILCRHALIVLQICGLSSIPEHYILKRWTKNAKNLHSDDNLEGHSRTRVQRYNDLSKLAIEMSEEGSLCEERYNIVLRSLVDTLKICVNVNNCNTTIIESGGQTLASHDTEDDSHEILSTKPSKKKNPVRKRKVQPDSDVMLIEAQESLQQMDTLGADGMALNGYYSNQSNVHGLVQLNLMEPPQDGYYVNQSSIQGLGQLSTLGATHDGFFSSPSIHGLGQFDFRPPSGFNYSMQDDPHIRSSELPGSATRHLKMMEDTTNSLLGCLPEKTV